jgi:hypothetical protein
MWRKAMKEEIKKIDYFDVDAVNHSSLKNIDISEKHYLYSKNKSTKQMSFGTLVHCMLLEPDEVDKRYFFMPKKMKKSTTEYKNFIKDIDLNGKEVIDIDEKEMALTMVENIKSKKVWKALAKNEMLFEHEMYWQDKETGLNCKGKADIVIMPNDKFKNGVIIDLKTSAKTCNNFKLIDYSYYSQASYYATGFKELYKTEDYPLFIFIPVESDAPHDAMFYLVTDDVIELGVKKNKKRLAKIKAIDYNNIKGYSDELVAIGLKDWEMKIIGEDL